MTRMVRTAMSVVSLVVALTATTVGAAAPAWVTLPTPDLVAADVAMSADGTVVYAGFVPGTPARAAVQVRPPGGPDVAVQLLSAEVGTGTVVAGTPDGTFVAAWIEGGRIMTAAMAPGTTTFTNPVPMPTLGGDVPELGSASPIAIGIDAAGNATVAWLSTVAISPTSQRLRVRVGVRSASGEVDPAESVDSVVYSPMAPSQTSFDGTLDVAVTDAGAAIVAWLRLDDTALLATTTLFAATRPAAGQAFGTPVVLDTATESSDPMSSGASIISSSVAANPSGEIAVVWERRTMNAIPPGPPTQTSSIRLRLGDGTSGLGAMTETVSPPGVFAHRPALAFASDGRVLVVWLFQDGVLTKLHTRVRSPGAAGSFGPVETPDLAPAPGELTLDHRAVWARALEPTVALANFNTTSFQSTVIGARGSSAGLVGSGFPLMSNVVNFVSALELATNPSGDTIVVAQRFTGAMVFSAGSSVFDTTGPVPRSLSVPASGRARQGAAFSVDPIDAWSTLGQTTWSFGDGATADGHAATHTYARKGTYRVSVTSTDVLGNATTTTLPVTIRSGVAPRILAAAQAKTRWVRGSGLPRRVASTRIRKGTLFTVRTDIVARLNFAFAQEVAGRRVGSRCVVPRAGNRTAPGCTRRVTVGRFAITGVEGRNRIAFAGRLSRSRTLPPGRYVVTVTATDLDGVRSASRTLRFSIT